MVAGPERGEGFDSVFEAELRAIEARRSAIAARRERVASLRADGGPASEKPSDPGSPPPGLNMAISGADERGRQRVVPRPDHNLTGLALSGGGIRSAAFCLGALQGLDAVRDDRDPQVLDAIDYLSTVSGGGYIGTALVSGMLENDGRFPFQSKLDGNETLETQHIRDYANYLMPNGAIDLLIGGVAVARGLLVNAVVFLAAILLLASFTVWLNPTSAELARPLLLDVRGSEYAFVWTGFVGAIFLALLGLSALRWPCADWPAMPHLTARELTWMTLALLVGFWAIIDRKSVV